MNKIKNKFSKVIIGGAQFGSNYGIANNSGKISKIHTDKIFSLAKENKINFLDTAKNYGESEKLLGKKNLKNWNVVSKLPSLPPLIEDISNWIESQVLDSLKSLKIKTLYGYLIHSPEQLLSNVGDEIWRALLKQKKRGLIRKIGYSIYNPKQLDKLFPEFRPDIVQSPYSILDRRLKKSGWLKKLKDKNIEIHIRSIFLQGLLLLEKRKRGNRKIN